MQKICVFHLRVSVYKRLRKNSDHFAFYRKNSKEPVLQFSMKRKKGGSGCGLLLSESTKTERILSFFLTFLYAFLSFGNIFEGGSMIFCKKAYRSEI